MHIIYAQIDYAIDQVHVLSIIKFEEEPYQTVMGQKQSITKK